MTEKIKEILGNRWTEVLDYISGALVSDISLLNETNNAILSRSGKQLRPMLSMLVAMACSGGKATEDSCRYAAASELLHNATLLHDDVADDSCQRRGMPTIRSLMGPEVSVLVGDYWLVKAMELIFSADEGSDKAMRIFSRTLSDLAEGEMFQLQKASTCDTVEEDYIKIIYKKTASLFAACAEVAALSVGASGETTTAMREFAVCLGLAFQIKDDIFDYSGMDVGKPTGTDILEKKITLPLIYAMDNASEEEAADIRRQIKESDGGSGISRTVSEFVKKYNGTALAQTRLEEYIRDGIDLLSVLPASRYRDKLEELAEYVGKRDI